MENVFSRSRRPADRFNPIAREKIPGVLFLTGVSKFFEASSTAGRLPPTIVRSLAGQHHVSEE
jgi:hypothetical protein